MTTTEPTPDTATEVVSIEPELCWVNLSALAPHPDNPRTNLGDLTEASDFHQMRGSPLLAISG